MPSSVIDPSDGRFVSRSSRLDSSSSVSGVLGDFGSYEG